MTRFMGEWDHAIDPPKTYGTLESYRRSAEFLDGACREVEDWGCGSGGARPFFSKSRYIGIDGSASPYADRVADLRQYTSSADGILIRHVLEHNYEWRDILRNAVKSFRKKMAIVFFLPLSRDCTRVWSVNPSGVPNLLVGRIALDEILSGLLIREESVSRSDGSVHKEETLFYVDRV